MFVAVEWRFLMMYDDSRGILTRHDFALLGLRLGRVENQGLAYEGWSQTH